VRSPLAAEPGRRCPPDGGTPSGGTTGSVSAEFAVAIPAVIALLIMCATGVQVENEQLQLQSAAAIAARSSSRGDNPALTAKRLEQAAPGAQLSVTRRDGMVCAHVSRASSGAIQSLLDVTLAASSCALANDG
jgi:Flp pilus assembly protein TadG